MPNERSFGMYKKAFIAVSLVLLLASVCTASRGRGWPRGKWWYDPNLTQFLNLTEAEKSRLDALFTESSRKMLEYKNDVERERFELDNLMSSRKVDEPAVQAQFKRLENARNRLAEERLHFMMGVRDILGFERFQALKNSYRKFEK